MYRVRITESTNNMVADIIRAIEDQNDPFAPYG